MLKRQRKRLRHPRHRASSATPSAIRRSAAHVTPPATPFGRAPRPAAPNVAGNGPAPQTKSSAATYANAAAHTTSSTARNAKPSTVNQAKNTRVRGTPSRGLRANRARTER